MGRLEISSRKLEIPREHLCKDGLDKGQKWYGPNRYNWKLFKKWALANMPNTADCFSDLNDE